MKEMKLLLYCIWHTYAQDMLAISRLFAVIYFPEGKFRRLICLIRMKIAIAFITEANRSFNYANRFMDDETDK